MKCYRNNNPLINLDIITFNQILEMLRFDIKRKYRRELGYNKVKVRLE